MLPETFQCFLIKKTGKEQIETAVERRPAFDLPAGEVVIKVAHSSLNYKDAPAATGHPGVAGRFPLVPGIDAAGTVVESASPAFREGDEVLATSYDLGVKHWGGWAELVRVPADWVVPLPSGLSLEESMILGTAGLTAGLCVRALQQHKIVPDSGDVLVTGATGGVGCLAVMILKRLHYNVVAVSGKADKYAWLAELGASRVVGRDEVLGDSRKPLLAARWAGVVDSVGGPMLASLLRSMQNEGCVAACGLVGGTELNTTVYPFILRGVTLAGIDSAWCPMPRRKEVWNLLAGPWKPDRLRSISQSIGLDQIQDRARQMLSGGGTGRTLVNV